MDQDITVNYFVFFYQLLDITEQPIGGGRELKRRKKLAGNWNILCNIRFKSYP